MSHYKDGPRIKSCGIAPAVWRYSPKKIPSPPSALSLLVFLIFLAGYRDRNYVEAATSSKPTIGTGGQHDAIALAPASNMTATDLDVSEIAVPRHRYQRLAHSPTLKIHGWSPPFDL